MNSGKTVFRQLLHYLPRHEFNVCVHHYRGEYRVQKFTTFDQFLCLAYAQISGRDSLRDIETCLNSHKEKLYHIGFRGDVSRTTLADANERRDWRIFESFLSPYVSSMTDIQESRFLLNFFSLNIYSASKIGLYQNKH